MPATSGRSGAWWLKDCRRRRAGKRRNRRDCPIGQCRLRGGLACRSNRHADMMAVAGMGMTDRLVGGIVAVLIRRRLAMGFAMGAVEARNRAGRTRLLRMRDQPQARARRPNHTTTKNDTQA